MNTKRLKLSGFQRLNHFLILPFFLIPPLFDIYRWAIIFFNNSTNQLNAGSQITAFTWTWILLAVFFFIIQKRRLIFREVKVEYSDSDFLEAVKRTSKQLEWHIEKNNKCIFRAYRRWNWTGSWGEMITIIKESDGLLLNSICDPNLYSSVASYGWNKRNIDKFLSNLSDVKRGIPMSESIEKPELEWSMKKILVRVIAMAFSLLLIGFGLYLIFNVDNLKSFVIGLVMISISFVYLFSDFKLILRNRKANSCL